VTSLVINFQKGARCFDWKLKTVFACHLSLVAYFHNFIAERTVGNVGIFFNFDYRFRTGAGLKTSGCIHG
jgi:hypothetical protein